MDGERAFLWKRKIRLGSEAKLELLCQWMALTNLLFSYCTTQIHHINTFSAHLNRPTIVEAIGESHELTVVFVSALIDACTICRQICVCKTFVFRFHNFSFLLWIATNALRFGFCTHAACESILLFWPCSCYLLMTAFSCLSAGINNALLSIQPIWRWH